MVDGTDGRVVDGFSVGFDCAIGQVALMLPVSACIKSCLRDAEGGDSFLPRYVVGTLDSESR